MDIEDEKDEYQTEESPESLADQVLAMNSREEMRVRLIQIFSHLKELKAKLDRWEQGTEEDFVIDKGDANDDSVVEITGTNSFLKVSPKILSRHRCDNCHCRKCFDFLRYGRKPHVLQRKDAQAGEQ